jgi:uncharacterized protein involved in outer membrane biogenesis
MTTPRSFSSARRGGVLAKLLLALMVLFVIGAIVWIAFLPRIVVSTIHSKTGFAVKLDQLAVNPFTAKVHLSGLVLQNPEGWPEAPAFVDLREFRADADLFPLLAGRFMADEVVVNLAQVTLVRNKDGVLNAVAFKEGLTGPDKKEPATKPKEPAKKTEFHIKRLVLKFDRLTYADHSGRAPVVREYNVAVDRELTDVDSVAAIIAPFRGAALVIVSDALGGMFSGSRDVLLDATKILQDGGKKAGESLKGLLQSLEKKEP